MLIDTNHFIPFVVIAWCIVYCLIDYARDESKPYLVLFHLFVGYETARLWSKILPEMLQNDCIGVLVALLLAMAGGALWRPLHLKK